MAKYKKKRARELQHDKFRDAAGRVFDRVGDRLEGQGKAIIYGIVGVIVLGVVIGIIYNWRNRKNDEARRAMGRAIAVGTTPLATASPAPISGGPTYANEPERAQRAIAEFQKVADKYGEPYRTQARYFIATNLLYVDRPRGLNELAEISKASAPEPATLAKFALAQAKEADGKLDEAAQLYSELAAQNSLVVSTDTANLRLATVYASQGKKNEAAELLFNIVEASRKAKDSDGLPRPPSGAAREAAEQLQKLDPERSAKLTPEAPRNDSPF